MISMEIEIFHAVCVLFPRMSRILCVTLHCPLRNIRIFYPDKEGKLSIIQNISGTMVDRARRTRSVWSIADKIDCSRYTGRRLF